MKIKERMLTLVNIMAGILIIYESISMKSICTKFSIAMVILLFLILLFRKKITIMEQKKFIFLLGYVIVYTFSKFFKYDIRFLIKSLLIIAKIFSFPVIIYCVIKLFKNIDKGYVKKIILVSNIILLPILLIIVLNSKNYNVLNILFLSLFTLYISLDQIEKKEKFLKYIILVVISLIAILLRNKIALVFNIFLCCVEVYKKLKQNSRLDIYISIFILIISSLLFVSYEISENNSPNINYKYLNINKECEMYNSDININDLSDIDNIFKYYSLTEIFFGIDYYNVNENNMSIVYIFSILGLMGFFVYIVIWKIILTNLNYKLEFIIIIGYLLITNSLLEPIIAFILSMLWLIDLRDLNIKEKEYGYKKKIILLMFLVILFSLLASYVIYYSKNDTNKSQEIILKMGDSLTSSSGFDLKIIDKKQKKSDKVVEELTYYELKNKNRVLAEIIYVKRNISDVIMQYITINNKYNKLIVKLEVSSNDLKQILNFNDYNVEYPYSTVVGQNKLKLPIGYYKDNEFNMIIGRSIEYNVLSINYDKNNKSTIYNLVDQKLDLENNYKMIEISPNNSVDTYIIKSNKNLFKNETSLSEFLDIMNNNSSWLKYSGNLYKVQYSIEPFTREGYGKMLGRTIEREIYDKSILDGSIIYKALAESSLFSLYNYTARVKEAGVWLTDYTSTWLSKDYNTKAYYVDTRYNETIGYYLLNIYENDKNDKYLESFFAYADFIVDEWNGTNPYMIDNVKMLPDYFSDANVLKTHSSLNHQLALVNYMFKSYEISGNKVYLKTAEEMLQNIVMFDKDWIRENGDLWYQVNQQGEFSGKDYEFVTLDDLLFTQNYLYEIKNEINETITLYIKSKVKYLKNQGRTLSIFEKKMMNKLNITI